MPHDEQTSDKKNVIASIAWPVVLHALVPLFWMAIVARVIPRIQVLYDQIGSELPASTRMALRFSNLVSHYPHIYLLVLTFFLAADAVIYLGALRSAGRAVARWWSMLVLLAQAAVAILTVVAVCFPIKTVISQASV